jgi:hypothetical protein
VTCYFFFFAAEINYKSWLGFGGIAPVMAIAFFGFTDSYTVTELIGGEPRYV